MFRTCHSFSSLSISLWGDEKWRMCNYLKRWGHYIFKLAAQKSCSNEKSKPLTDKSSAIFLTSLQQLMTDTNNRPPRLLRDTLTLPREGVNGGKSQEEMFKQYLSWGHIQNSEASTCFFKNLVRFRCENGMHGKYVAYFVRMSPVRKLNKNIAHDVSAYKRCSSSFPACL